MPELSVFLATKPNLQCASAALALLVLSALQLLTRVVKSSRTGEVPRRSQETAVSRKSGAQPECDSDVLSASFPQRMVAYPHSQKRLCTDAAKPFLCPPTPPQPQAAKDARLAILNTNSATARNNAVYAESTWQRQRCKDCADSSSGTCKPQLPACSGAAEINPPYTTDSAACCNAFLL